MGPVVRSYEIELAFRRLFSIEKKNERAKKTGIMTSMADQKCHSKWQRVAIYGFHLLVAGFASA